MRERPVDLRDFFGLVGSDGAEVGADGEALGAVLVAGGAGALVDGMAAGIVGGEFQGAEVFFDDAGAGG